IEEVVLLRTRRQLHKVRAAQERIEAIAESARSRLLELRERLVQRVLPIVYATQLLPRALAVRVTTEIRSEEHTSELQSRENLVCRLLLEKKKNLCTHRTPRS